MYVCVCRHLFVSTSQPFGQTDIQTSKVCTTQQIILVLLFNSLSLICVFLLIIIQKFAVKQHTHTFIYLVRSYEKQQQKLKIKVLIEIGTLALKKNRCQYGWDRSHTDE